jgi:hypothetical protein
MEEIWWSKSWLQSVLPWPSTAKISEPLAIDTPATTNESSGDIAMGSGLLPPALVQTAHGAEHGGAALLLDVDEDCWLEFGVEFEDMIELMAAAAPRMTIAETASTTERVLLVMNLVDYHTRFDSVWKAIFIINRFVRIVPNGDLGNNPLRSIPASTSLANTLGRPFSWLLIHLPTLGRGDRGSNGALWRIIPHYLDRHGKQAPVVKRQKSLMTRVRG